MEWGFRNSVKKKSGEVSDEFFEVHEKKRRSERKAGGKCRIVF